MKSIVKSLALLHCLVCILTFTGSLTAQPPAPPSEHGLNGNQGAGGEAPVDGGVALLVLCGLGYGGWKLGREFKNKYGRVVRWSGGQVTR